MVARAVPALIAPSPVARVAAPVSHPAHAVEAPASGGLGRLDACARQECRFLPREPLRPVDPQAARQYWTGLMASHLPDSLFGSAALWLATQHVQVDLRANRVYVVVRVDGP